MRHEDPSPSWIVRIGSRRLADQGRMRSRLHPRRWTQAVALLAALCHAPTAFAGMPAPTLTDAGQMRLRSLGFFLALFFGLAKLFQSLWNWLRKDFPKLPILGYRRAVGMVFVWGMALELVLTMVSGARELLTPGAWEKVGTTYQVKPAVAGASVLDQSPAARRSRLDRLGRALQALSALPKSARTSGLPDDLWAAPGGTRYVYMGEAVEKAGVIAYEPPLAGSPGAERLVLLRDFTIVSWSETTIDQRLTEAFQ